jgi:hypothetical protein
MKFAMKKLLKGLESIKLLYLSIQEKKHQELEKLLEIWQLLRINLIFL